MSSKIAASCLALIGIALASPDARAQQASPQDAALAQSLFDQARRSMQDGKWSEACPKLAESERLDPALGTLLNLAVCHEKEGRTASAWSEYRDAEAFARREGRAERESYARGRAAALEPRLAHVTIARAPNDSTSALEVRLDDVPLGAAAIGTAVPIDPGDHSIDARAPGKRSWSTTVHVAADATSVTVAVPVLEDAPAPPAPVVVPPEPEPMRVIVLPPIETTPAPAGPRRTRTPAYVVGATALGALAFGSVAGLQAIVQWDDRKAQCTGDACTAAGLSADHSAKEWAIAADVGVGVGVVGLAVATYLFFVPVETSGPRPEAIRLGPLATPGGGGVAIDGAW